MVEHTKDPCAEEEKIEQPDPYAPEIPPIQPRALKAPTAAFPAREPLPIERITTRVSGLVEKFSLNENFKSYLIRLPEEAYQPSLWQDNPQLIDTFRFVAGKNFYINKNENSLFQWITRDLRAIPKAGVYFDIELNSQMIEKQEKSDVVITFNLPMLEELLSLTNIPETLSSIGGDPNLFASKFIYGLITGDEKYGAGSIPLISDTLTYKYDSSFFAPAAFFESEAEQSTVPLTEVVSIVPVVGDLPLVETEKPDAFRTSVYRIYANAIDNTIPKVVRPDGVQKFDATAVSKLDEVMKSSTNQLIANPGFSGLDRTVATDQLLASPLFAKSEAVLNTHIKISFNINHQSKFCQIMKKHCLDTVFMDFLAALDAQEVDTNYVQVLDQSVFGGEANNRIVYNYDPVVYNGKAFVDKIFESATQTLSYMKAVKKQHPLPPDQEYMEKLASIMAENTMTGEPEAEIDSFIQSRVRPYHGILVGKPAPSEIVGFRVEKILLDTDEVVQSFYFFNDPDTRYIDFLDSQVTYMQGYKYRIYAINAVIGNRFFYDKENRQYHPSDFVPKSGPPQYIFKVSNEPFLSFVETPYFEQDVFMIDKPPMFPQCEVIPFFQNATRVGFRMTPTYGKIKEKPIAILEEDGPMVEKMFLSQASQALYSGKIEYSSDSQPTKYELLLLDTKPFSYQDFSDSIKFTVNAIYNSGYIELPLMPSKRYYMIFRASDGAGISNPSLVYTIVLNDHADGVFVEFDEFDLIPEALDEPITFEKILKIDPSPEQCSVDFSNLSLSNDFYLSAPSVKELELGIVQNKLWSKDYKFRLKSRSSGRALDINVKYGYKVVNPPEPLDIDLLSAYVDLENPFRAEIDPAIERGVILEDAQVDPAIRNIYAKDTGKTSTSEKDNDKDNKLLDFFKKDVEDKKGADPIGELFKKGFLEQKSFEKDEDKKEDKEKELPGNVEDYVKDLRNAAAKQAESLAKASDFLDAPKGGKKDPNAPLDGKRNYDMLDFSEEELTGKSDKEDEKEKTIFDMLGEVVVGKGIVVDTRDNQKYSLLGAVSKDAKEIDYNKAMEEKKKEAQQKADSLMGSFSWMMKNPH